MFKSRDVCPAKGPAFAVSAEASKPLPDTLELLLLCYFNAARAISTRASPLPLRPVAAN